MKCDNCGIESTFKKIGYDELDNLILECKECGAICYDDGSFVEDEVRIVRGVKSNE